MKRFNHTVASKMIYRPDPPNKYNKFPKPEGETYYSQYYSTMVEDKDGEWVSYIEAQEAYAAGYNAGILDSKNV